MEIVIRFDQTGRLQVGCSVGNLLLALGMLEAAKSHLIQQVNKPAESGVSVPNPELARHLLNGAGG